MKIEDVITSLEHALNKGKDANNLNLLVLHKTIEPTSFKAYSKYTYILYDVQKNSTKYRLLTFQQIVRKEKKFEDTIEEAADKQFLNFLMDFIGTDFNNLKENNYEAIKVRELHPNI